MAIRSLLLAIAVTGSLAYFFMFGVAEPNSSLKKIPDWVSIHFVIGCGLLYLLAGWWAIRGFSEHKIMALLALALCAFGLSAYALVWRMSTSHGKAAARQYDYDFSAITPTEQTVVVQIAKDTGLKLTDAVFTEHWHLNEPTPGFRICVRHGHVTALNLSGHVIRSLIPFSQLPKLSDLYLQHCNLSDLHELQCPNLDRLDVSDNQITDLTTGRGCPNLRWLSIANNRLTSTDGLAQLPRLVSQDLSGNPLP